ncbi:MAG: PilZ domain-containing protein [Proteobacteria bacterium]|nr:PilZ domain-containing protein [Pseudomonadota bacterium]
MSSKKERSYFRIIDYVGLNYRRVEVKQYNALRLANQNAEVPSIDALAEIDQQMQMILNRLKIKNPDVAELVKLLNRKIQQILKHSHISEGLMKLDTYPQRRVDLSASGIAFPTSEFIPVDHLLELELVLQPGRQHLKLLAMVVTSEADTFSLNSGDDSLTHVVRTKFIDINDDIQEFLIQYVVKRQASIIRADRNENIPMSKQIRW